ncbi:BspA family leucine-rich repeat surface protein [Listeria monocytogenes]|nr:BspA family leucine-rich repeat surface protein [Listeria monocytogenes]
MDFKLNKRKKTLRQLVVALLLLCTIGLPIQNIVLANEFSATEEVVTEATEIKESAIVESNTSNSEDIESESVPLSEKEAESTEITFSEIVLKESEVLTDTSDFNFAEKQEFSEEPRSATQQNEGRPSTKAVTTGTFPNGSTATWTFDDATGTLSISGGTLINPNRSIDGLIGIPVTKITNIVLEDKVFASGNCQTLFRDSAATSLDLSNLDTSNVTSMRQMFYSNAATSLDLSNFDTSKVTDMYYMFAASAATSLDLSNWDTSNVISMDSMFYGSLATSLDVSSFDTSNVTNMRQMFIGSLATSLDLSNFDTSKVTNMYGMFQYSAATSLNLSNFDTSNVTNMGNMFDRSAVTSLDLSNFDTSKVTGMNSMFNQSVATSLDLSSFDTSKVANMTNMFAGASQLQMLTLGSQFKFVGTAAALPNPTPTAKYTGKWQNVGSGTIDKPTGTFGGTATELMSTYDGSTMADLYVWQQPFLNVKDSMLMIGDNWNPEYNFSDAIDSAGDPVDFNAITVTGSVDTTQPGVYTVTYSYGGITSTATVTVLETMPASWINFFVDGTNARAIPGSALSTPEWDLTTGLWDKWNPGTVKVPTDKLPSEPTKQGYVFKGWKDNTGAMVDFNTLDLDLNSQHEFNFYAVFEKVNSTNPSIEPPTKPGEGPNVVSPTAPGAGGNQPPSNDSGLNTVNTGNTMITSQEDIVTSFLATSQEGKLAKLGENNSLLLQGFGALMVLSGVAFFLVKRRKMHS